MISKTKKGIMALCLFFMASCQSSTVDAVACNSLVSDIPSERINTNLVLTTPDNQRDYSVQEDLRIFADNYSDNVLESAPDKDLQVYLWNDSSWMQIKNKLDYLSRVDRFGVKSIDDPGGHTYYVFYDTSLIKEPTRACVILRAVEDPENALLDIASYIEIEISP